MNAPIQLIRDRAETLSGSAKDYDSLLDLIGTARFVLIGEASHGTHEFYRERAQITKRLVKERGFQAVAIEGDWPDAYRINRFVHARSEDVDSVDALSGFRRFPAWMWRNADVLDFVGWLRAHNDDCRSEEQKAGFYGLDLYSLHASIGAVLTYIERVDPSSVKRARHRYACFERFGKDVQNYGLAAAMDMGKSCEQEAVTELIEMRLREAQYLQRDGRIAEDEFFFAEQNARLIKNAEEYYRTMFLGRVSSWNLRDRHMFETVEALVKHMADQGQTARIVLWAHNSHLGDARATDMSRMGEWNIGQLMREHFPNEVVSIGFTTFHGTVTAASEWDAPAERKQVRPALTGSYEALFHDAGIERFLVNLRDDDVYFGLLERRLERAIGVIYLPETERASHYFEASLPDQFDAVIHVDETRAVEPLERTVEWQEGEVEETFPTGI